MSNYKNELKQQIAEIFGCPSQELDGLNVYKSLRELPPEYVIYWGCIDKKISENEVF